MAFPTCLAVTIALVGLVGCQIPPKGKSFDGYACIVFSYKKPKFCVCKFYVS